MKYYSIIFLVVVSNLSCDYEIKIDSGLENFEVIVDNTTITAGDNITFIFKGNPNIISFYSGETSHQYEYKEGRIGVMSTASLSFTNAHPSAVNPQSDQFSLLISTDYEDLGKDYEDILTATWIDITDRFKYATSGTYIESGEAEITDAIENNKTFYFGLRYANKTHKGTPRRWHIQNFIVSSLTRELDEIYLSNSGFTGFRLIEQHPETPSPSSITASTIILDGNPSSTNESSETWALSYPMYFGNIDYGPDRPIGIKGHDQDIESFSYTYSSPGVYDVVFVAKNITIDQESEVYRHLQITVNEETDN